MLHDVCRGRLEAYAEGTLSWPVARLVERHSRNCKLCREELRGHLALVRRFDQALFRQDEMVRTVSTVMQREVQKLPGQRSRGFWLLSPVGMATMAILFAISTVPAITPWGARSDIGVLSASSWGEGFATSIAVASDRGVRATSLEAHSWGVSTGVRPQDPGEEWGG